MVSLRLSEAASARAETKLRSTLDGAGQADTLEMHRLKTLFQPICPRGERIREAKKDKRLEIVFVEQILELVKISDCTIIVGQVGEHIK